MEETATGVEVASVEVVDMVVEDTDVEVVVVVMREEEEVDRKECLTARVSRPLLIRKPQHFEIFFEQLSYFSQVGVGVLTGGKNGNQTTQIIWNETRQKCWLKKWLNYNFGEKIFEFMAQFRGAC